MFITDALKEKVNQSLCAIEVRSAWFERLKETPEWWADTTTCWATERALHVAIECVVDAANALIDALVMRDPGGYLDILRVIAEEQVVSFAWFEAFSGVMEVREQLLRNYVSVSPEVVRDAVVSYAPLLPPFVAAVRDYLGISG
ncbi:DUF86 domain-containing protein [Alicyclobacillus contaminans]|uniref:DUF86 domain-containing protein n=1 Tax=Alicyclobacillus contaminans TaxID=392016 RepID=UPI0004178158|nr:HepT-like ribonuclease domain-containing protein [Alicyclobacillus contaminans]